MNRRPLRQKPLRKLGNRAGGPELARESGFGERAAREGTVPLPKSKGRVPPPRSSPNPLAVATAARAPEFEIRRDEEFIDGRRQGLAGPVLKLLRGAPRASLDLHGLDAASARREVARFVSLERRRGTRLVLLVVGKGRRSPGGHGVLRGEVGDFLTSAPSAEHVLAFRTAPPEQGGSGAVLVLLEAPRR